MRPSSGVQGGFGLGGRHGALRTGWRGERFQRFLAR
ncbi:hypothetical protein BPC006_II1002 [Burkholderia pseudomallei BPC006]|nr:hypothetical protein BPC006_II1002 [Burkholderia pseudomallei BPC006]